MGRNCNRGGNQRQVCAYRRNRATGIAICSKYAAAAKPIAWGRPLSLCPRDWLERSSQKHDATVHAPGLPRYPAHPRSQPVQARLALRTVLTIVASGPASPIARATTVRGSALSTKCRRYTGYGLAIVKIARPAAIQQAARRRECPNLPYATRHSSIIHISNFMRSA